MNDHVRYYSIWLPKMGGGYSLILITICPHVNLGPRPKNRLHHHTEI